MKKLLVGLVFTAMSFVPIAQAQNGTVPADPPQASSDQESPGAQRDKPAEKPQRADNGIVSQAPATPPSTKQSDEEERERQEKLSFDRRLAIATERLAEYTLDLAWATGVLAFLTFGLVGLAVWQASGAARAERAARESAEAAKASAAASNRTAEAAFQALEKGQSPYLHPSFRLAEQEEAYPQIEPGTWAKFILCDFTNYGNSPAVIVSHDIKIIDWDQFEKIDVSLGSMKTGEGPSIIRPTETGTLDKLGITQEQFSLIEFAPGLHMHRSIKIQGYIRYADITGDEYIMAVSARTPAIGSPFFITRGSETNRRRKITQDEIMGGATISFWPQ